MIPTLPTGGDDISIVRRLLLDSPKELYILCNKLMSKIIPGYHEDEFLDYLIAKDKKYENRSPYEKLLYRKYYNTLNQIRKTFDYEGQLAKINQEHIISLWNKDIILAHIVIDNI